jgi:uncharacterized protein YebE (UPF0316 family)
MVNKILFTFLLILICAGSFFIGLKPMGPIALWQVQFNLEEVVEIDAETDTDTEIESKENKGKIIDIQRILSDKSQQIMDVWFNVKLVRDVVNTLQSADARAVFVAVDPLEALAPFDKSLGRMSGLLLFMYGFLIFEKTLLAIFIAATFMILIPLCALYTISIIWNKKNQYKIHKVVIVFTLICFVMPIALPISLGLPAILEEKVLSSSIDNIITSVDESGERALKMDSDLRGLRRIGVSIVNNITIAKELSGDVIRNSINYFIIFLMINLLLPVILIFGCYKIIRYSSKLILTR